MSISFVPPDPNSPLLPSTANNGLTVSGPSLFSALEEQLGLELEAARAPVEVLVIEQAERPSEN